jgi:hypothetical protein
MSKEFEGKLIEMNGKVDDAIRQLTDATSVKARLLEENLTFGRRIESLEFEFTSLQSIYKRTQGDLDEARLHLESEMAVRKDLIFDFEMNFVFFKTNRILQSTVKTFQMDLESTKLQLEDELDAKVELQKLLIKIQEETRLLRDRLEKEIEGKNEEIEDQRFDFYSKSSKSNLVIFL